MVSRPYRPRARALGAPTGATALERIRTLTASEHATAHGETVELSPANAAARILAELVEWGYLNGPANHASTASNASPA